VACLEKTHPAAPCPMAITPPVAEPQLVKCRNWVLGLMGSWPSSVVLFQKDMSLNPPALSASVSASA
jgi:hypothetical protein